MISRRLAALGLTASLLPRPSAGQEAGYPARPIRMINAFAAGGAVDVATRAVSQLLAQRLGQPVVVENRTGAGGNVGMDVVAKAAPDGYMLGMGTIATHGINPTLYGARMPFDAERDFAPVALATTWNQVVVVHPALPIATMPELVAHARAHPGELTFGSAGSGTAQHLAAELFASANGVRMVHVPFRGAAQSTPELLAGRLSLIFSEIPTVLEHVRAGRLRAIGVTAAHRSPTLPEVPSVAEQGFPGYDVVAWAGLFAPAGTPPDRMRLLMRETAAVLRDPALQERLGPIGMEPATLPAEAFPGFIAAEIRRWAPVVRGSGARAE